MSKPIKIAITGQMRAGKDVVCGHLSTIHDFQPYALADEGKAIVHRIYPDLPRHPKPRRYYQVVIDEMTKMDVPGAQDVWIDLTLRKIDDYLTRVGGCNCERMTVLKPRVVISDVRKPREVERLRAEGFTLIRVTAPVELRLARARAAGDEFDEQAIEHETERAVDGFDVDYEIANDGDLVTLLDRVDEVVGEIISKGER